MVVVIKVSAWAAHQCPPPPVIVLLAVTNFTPPPLSHTLLTTEDFFTTVPVWASDHFKLQQRSTPCQHTPHPCSMTPCFPSPLTPSLSDMEGCSPEPSPSKPSPESSNGAPVQRLKLPHPKGISSMGRWQLMNAIMLGDKTADFTVCYIAILITFLNSYPRCLLLLKPRL